MKHKADRADKYAPSVQQHQVNELTARLVALRGVPLREAGETTVCPDCGGRMTTTNDLERSVASPGVVFIVSRLPGARCIDCGASQLDASGIGILEATAPKALIGDYETAVTHSSGSTLGTYFKMDLARVLKLEGAERLFWTVVDRNLAMVRVERPSLGSEQTASGMPARRGRPEAVRPGEQNRRRLRPRDAS